MGSSAKKKKEKKKDFQKTKLKVGKSTPKAANSTSTSFKAKRIQVNQQINSDAPLLHEQFLHHVSLLSSRSDSQRKESISYLASTIQSELKGKQMPLSTKDFLAKILPLLLDSSFGVRSEFSKLFQALPEQDIGDYAELILPYIRAGMTHLSTDIRRVTMDVLMHFNTTSGKELVSAPGGWTKTLQCFASNLGFKDFASNETWSVHRTSFKDDTRMIARTMQVAEKFLVAGLLDDFINEQDKHDPANDFPLWDQAYHRVPAKSNPYGYLNLFGQPLDNNSRQLEDREERVLEFKENFHSNFSKSLARARQEGGDIGRAAGQMLKVIELACRDG